MVRKHEYSQHFLASRAIVAELVGHSNIRKNDIVYDLGAGSGIISDTLAKRARAVVAVEVEPEALKQLRINLSSHENVEIVARDIMEVVPGHDNYKVFANPPFSIIAPLVRRFTALPNSPEALYLIVQKQFAFKTVPSDRHFTSQLGARLAPYYAARVRKPLRRTDFTPPPAVDTVLLELKRREEPLLPIEKMHSYAAFITDCYSDPKRLAAAASRLPHKLPRTKPSELSTQTWIELYQLRS